MNEIDSKRNFENISYQPNIKTKPPNLFMRKEEKLIAIIRIINKLVVGGLIYCYFYVYVIQCHKKMG